MRKSQRSGMYPYLRLSRGEQVVATLAAGVGDVTVQVTGDIGVLAALGEQRADDGSRLLRYAVTDSGSASIEATSEDNGAPATYVAGVTATC